MVWATYMSQEGEIVTTDEEESTYEKEEVWPDNTANLCKKVLFFAINIGESSYIYEKCNIYDIFSLQV